MGRCQKLARAGNQHCLNKSLCKSPVHLISLLNTGTLVECVAAAAATTKSNGIQAWEVAVPATLGTLVLLAAFAAVIKFAPGVLDDMALLRMLNLKRG